METSSILIEAAHRLDRGANRTLLGAIACASEEPGDFTHAMKAFRRAYPEPRYQRQTGEVATMMLLFAAQAA